MRDEERASSFKTEFSESVPEAACSDRESRTDKCLLLNMVEKTGLTEEVPAEQFKVTQIKMAMPKKLRMVGYIQGIIK
jgi:hypothetical protein